MLVSQIDIREFRGIRRCEKPLEFTRFTVLVGKNNAGKSAVLEAIYLLLASHEYVSRAYGIPTLKILQELHGGASSLVYGYSGIAGVEYTIDGSKIGVETDGGKTRLVRDGKEVSTEWFASTLNINLSGGNADTAFFMVPSDTAFLKKLADNLMLEKNWNPVVKSGAHVRIAKLVSRCVDDSYTEALISPNELRLRKELPDGNFFYVKISDLGSGLKRAVPVMLWLEAFQPGVVLWDDLEISAHPSLVKQLLTWLSEKDMQVVISTHSIDVLSQLLEVKPKEAQVIMLKKTAEDILCHNTLSIDDLETVMDFAQHDPRLIAGALEGTR
ncbi:MAG: AAA family ATPase [Candidatus Freyrarchaeum guaymaensis]